MLTGTVSATASLTSPIIGSTVVDVEALAYLVSVQVDYVADLLDGLHCGSDSISVLIHRLIAPLRP